MINLYRNKEIILLQKSGEILNFVINQLVRQIKIGTTGTNLDQRARQLLKKMKAEPSFLGYRNFPAALCVSVNHQLVHGIPSKKPFQKGDLISLDLGARYRGFCTDKAVTILLESHDQGTLKFIKTVKQSLKKGIRKARAGNRLGAISNAIQEGIEEGGYKVVRNLSGHGIGRNVHEDPRIFNFGKKDDGPVLKEGMVLAIEPMACMKTSEIKVEKDGNTIASLDHSLCAHFEETIAIGENNPIVLTQA